MTCKQVQAELVACWGSTEQLSAMVIEHLEVCEECRYEALILRETHVIVRSIPQERAPEGFTDRVLAEIDAEQAQPGWLKRLSEFFIPAQRPAWARAAAVGTAIALAVAGGAVWFNQADQPDQQQIAVAPETPITATASADADEAELEELLVRHQAAEMSQPLADDAGVTLVVYTSN
ncbi:MAG: hypothetical protein GF393_01960 [Armatimonadia bacterium]|nr:hypothetical protein [Armatimonadia bacterium]